MKTLSYSTLREMDYTGYLLETAPVRVLQFGEGNFLRAFVENFIDLANERTDWKGKVTLVQPIEQGGLEKYFAEQQGLYTLYLRGRENGEAVCRKRVISAVDSYINPYESFADYLDAAGNPDLRYIVSNTTEAGIVYDASCNYSDTPPASFPAKLTVLLHERWKRFGGEASKGLVILSCELIDDNGKILDACVKQHIAAWGLEEDFALWVQRACLFCSTLVDRIVTGYPRTEAEALNAENGYVDNLLDTGELFALWVIEGPEWLAAELPFLKADLPIKVVADHTPYKKQKVRILNGAHTAMVPMAYLCGQDIVRNAMFDEDIGAFLRKAVWEEIIPVTPLPREELEAFAASVDDRFKNPYIDHALLSIALNCTSKWRARVLPSLKEYLAQKGELPACLSFSLAAYIAFCAQRNDRDYALQDDASVLELFRALRPCTLEGYARPVLENADLWGEDLTALPGLLAAVEAGLREIEHLGMRGALRGLLEK